MQKNTAQKLNAQAGQILIFTAVILAIVTSMVASLVGYGLAQIRAHRQALNRAIGLDIAEAGVELAIWKLNHVAGYAGETNTAYDKGVYNVSLNNFSAGTKTIKVDSFVPDAINPIAHRTIQVTLALGTKNIGFNYAVQSGAGGFQLENNARIVGNVYSNGVVTGANGAKVTGDLTSVSSVSNVEITGNTYSDTLFQGIIGGNTKQHTSITDSLVAGTANSSAFLGTTNKCKITGAATYNTNNTCSFLGGSTTPNTAVPPVAPPIPLPIPDQQMIDWQTEAAGGVNYASSQTINGTVTMGPAKINGDLTVNGTLYMTGTIWVTGSITAANGSIIQLSPSYGNLTGVLIAGIQGSSTAGFISVPNNAILAGSGSTGSYLLVISLMNNTVSNAIDISNNAISAIIYSGTGITNISNNAQLREVTAWKIHLNQNVQLTSDAGLTNIEYFNGSSGGWEMIQQTWQLLL